MVQYCISIVGAGYVGLCTAVAFASKGYKVITADRDPEKVTLINKGISPFSEHRLEESLQKVVKDGRLSCMLGCENAILSSDITFIAVGTPSKPDGSINLGYVESAACEIGQALKRKRSYHLIVVKSTVVPGTTEMVVKLTIENISGKRCGIKFGLCVNPEFLREGCALHDVLNPDRIIIGEYDQKSGDILESIYKDFYGRNMPTVIRTNLPTAELTKYANNTFLVTKISFINTIANICEKVPGADVKVVAKGIGLDKRIEPLFLNAGLGYGGSCLPKDVRALIAFSKDLGYNPLLLNDVEEVNKAQANKAVELCETILDNLKDKRIAVLGLAFKPNTDDMRGATSIKIINQLLQRDANVVAYDPAAMNNAKKIFKDKIEYATSAIDCIKGADCCIIITEWDEFKRLNPEDFVKQMRKTIIIDGRRVYNPNEFKKKVKFAAVGLGTS